MKLFFLVSYIVLANGTPATIKAGPVPEKDCWAAHAMLTIEHVLNKDPKCREIRFDCVPAE